MLFRTNPRNGDRISQLSFGCMRFPREQARVNELVRAAVERGVNYFDTAYIYGGSEVALGLALKEGKLRDRVKIATKLPLTLCRSAADFDRLFATQLARLQTERVDYYFLHMLGDLPTFERFKAMGIVEWIAAKKAEGAIVNIGFSFHGERHEFTRLLDAYPWDFCQIQYNYYDENTQAGRYGLEYAAKKGVPVIAMCPLGGGLLVNNLPEAAKAVFLEVEPQRSMSEWALRWIWDQPGIMSVLSGMTSLDQLYENVAVAETTLTGCLSPMEREAYTRAVAAINEQNRIPCTGCGYCLPCPQNVNIPDAFIAYNTSYKSRIGGIRSYLMASGAIASKQMYASQCNRCRVCEKSCPQGIEISRELPRVARRMESFWFRPAFAFVRKIAIPIMQRVTR